MSVYLDGFAKDVTKTTFPGGESCIRINPDSFRGVPGFEAAVVLEFENNGDLIDLALLVDAYRRQVPGGKLTLRMPYVPYARQDRVCNPGESLSIKVIADFINGLKFENVVIFDPHSDVATALFDNVFVIGQEWYAERVARKMDRDNTIVVAPDAGASKKATKFAQKGGFAGLIQAEKVRDLPTGKILETRVPDILVGSLDLLIVDDICDGGRTFTELAKVLRPKTTGKIMLYVTHGIFSAGPEVFDGLIDVVYTANPVGQKAKDAIASGKVIKL
jgi:ribose-phosphate pyrophosphokinase